MALPRKDIYILREKPCTLYDLCRLALLGNYHYIFPGQCHTANCLHVSKLTKLMIFHESSPRVYRDFSTVIFPAVVQRYSPR